MLKGSWMNRHILHEHGSLCSLYKAHDNGDYRSEGDSPAFFHVIPTGLRSYENPGWGGWGGRYVRIRENTWLDEVHEKNYKYPEGRWYTSNAWGRTRLQKEIVADTLLRDYLRPMWRWMVPLQNDFAARADWCVKDYAEANHSPVVKCNHYNIVAKPGAKIKLSAKGSYDPDGDNLTYRWWHYAEAGTYKGTVCIEHADDKKAIVNVPDNATEGSEIHIICEVTDNGSPRLTRYSRTVITVSYR